MENVCSFQLFQIIATPLILLDLETLTASNIQESPAFNALTDIILEMESAFQSIHYVNHSMQMEIAPYATQDIH
jgi:hypothetical protein